MLYIWAILFLILAVVLSVSAFGGVAIAVSFFTKVMFALAFVSLLAAIVLFAIGKIKAKANAGNGSDIEIEKEFVTENTRLNERY